MPVYILEAVHWKARGSWTDKYLIQAESEEEAKEMCKAESVGASEVRVFEIDLSTPYQINED